jgi:predicted kinase
MIGPAGAGKSTYALANYAADEVRSSDDLRIELYGSHVTAGSQAKIFEVLRERAVARLRRGETAVIDATNLKQRDRLQLIDVMPGDLTIIYIVIDRSMEAKVRDGGWRNEREGLLEGHAATFAAELDAILRGDGRLNVKV